MAKALPIPTQPSFSVAPTLEYVKPFSAWSGPRDPKIVIVGECWGETESLVKRPFAGHAGRELWRMLGQAWPTLAPEMHGDALRMMKYDAAWVGSRDPWLHAARVGLTTVFNFRPPGGKMGTLCGNTPIPGLSPLGRKGPDFPQGAHLMPEFWPHLPRLWEELAIAKPNLILVMGNTAAWATLGVQSIGAIRGTVAGASTPGLSGLKILPTYHPAGVLRNWSWRPIVVADLMKAGREMEFPEIRRPKRQVIVNPTLAEARAWVDETFGMEPPRLGCDIETERGQIKCISFARSPSEALVIPFWDETRPGWNYFSTEREEIAAWGLVERLLSGPWEIVGQNFIYDLQYITRMGILPTRVRQDTMLLHHSLFPELPKGLGFLGSIYTDEASWKLMNRPKAETEKRDE